MELSSRLPQVMKLKMEGLGSINAHGGKHTKVQFSIGDDQWWSSDKKRCRAGKFDTIRR